MKTIIRVFLFVCFLLLLVCCENNTVNLPKAEVAINQTQFSINESMIISFTGNADHVVIFTGDDMHNYELRDQGNTGFVVNKGLFSYSYTSPGVYKVVCIATTHNDLAMELKRDTSSYKITVIDDETEIEKLSCPQILYDEVFANKLDNDEWLMILPRKVKYGNSTPTISMTKQRLKFYIQSDSAKVFINDVGYSPTARYDLSVPIDVRVQSNFGTDRLYKLYTMNYPEFISFKLLNVEGVFVRNEYDYSSFMLNVTLPAGTDVTNLIPQFTTTSETDKVYINDIEQTSAISKVNFTQDVTYKLVSVLSVDQPDKKVMSTVKVKVNFQ